MFPFSGLSLSQSFYGQIIGFSTAGGKDNFFGVSVDKGGDLFAGGIQGLTALFTPVMNGLGIAVDLLEIGKHGLDHLR